MEGLFAAIVLPADIKNALCSVCFPQDADSLFGRVTLAFHFLGPFCKISDYHSG